MSFSPQKKDCLKSEPWFWVNMSLIHSTKAVILQMCQRNQMNPHPPSPQKRKKSSQKVPDENLLKEAPATVRTWNLQPPCWKNTEDRKINTQFNKSSHGQTTCLPVTRWLQLQLSGCFVEVTRSRSSQKVHRNDAGTIAINSSWIWCTMVSCCRHLTWTKD